PPPPPLFPYTTLFRSLFTPPQPAGGGGRGRGPSLGAATTAIPGVVFQGSSDGKLYAVSAADGKQLWEYDTAKEFETINRVPAHEIGRAHSELQSRFDL